MVYTSTKKVKTSFEDDPTTTPIPVKRATAATPQIQNIPIEQPVVQNIPEINEYMVGGQRYRETNQTVRRVVKTYAVIQ